MSAIAKTTFMACRVAKLVKKINELLGNLDDLKDLGIDKIEELRTRYNKKIKDLESSVVELTDLIKARIKALKSKMISLINNIIDSIKKSQESIMSGIEEMVNKIAEEYEGVSVEIEVVNDFKLVMIEEDDLANISTSGGFDIKVSTSIELLNCDTNLIDSSLIALRTLPVVVGSPAFIDPISVTA